MSSVAMKHKQPSTPAPPSPHAAWMSVLVVAAAIAGCAESRPTQRNPIARPPGAASQGGASKGQARDSEAPAREPRRSVRPAPGAPVDQEEQEGVNTDPPGT